MSAITPENSGEPKEQFNFRCDKNAKAEFERHVGRLGWSVPKTLEMLVRSANALFAGKEKPERPLLVVDAVDDDGSEKKPAADATSELKAEMDRLTKWHLKEVERIVKEAAGDAFEEKFVEKLKRRRGARGVGGRVHRSD